MGKKKSYGNSSKGKLIIVVALLLIVGVYLVWSFKENGTVLPIPAEDVLAKNLVSFIPLHSNTSDVVSKVKGTVTGVVKFQNNSAYFDGKSYISYPYNASIAKQKFCFGICVKDQNTTKQSYYASKYHSWTLQQYVATNSTTSRINAILYQTTSTWHSAGKFYPDKSWHSYVYMYDGKELSIYVDKSKNDQNPLNYTMPDDKAYGLNLGGSQANSRGLIGWEKNFRYYDDTCSSAQIARMYQECME